MPYPQMFTLGKSSLAEFTLQVTHSARSLLLDVHLGFPPAADGVNQVLLGTMRVRRG